MKIRTQEAARILGVSVSMVGKYRDYGHLTVEKDGRNYLFDRDEVIEFAQSKGIIHQIDVKDGKALARPRAAIILQGVVQSLYEAEMLSRVEYDEISRDILSHLYVV